MNTQQIVLLILKGGENLLGMKTYQDDDIFKLEDIVAFAPNPNGKGVMTIPYLQFSVEKDATFSIEKDIRHVLTPNEDLTNYYNETFNKIIVPDNKLINPIMMPVD